MSIFRPFTLPAQFRFARFSFPPLSHLRHLPSRSSRSPVHPDQTLLLRFVPAVCGHRSQFLTMPVKSIEKIFTVSNQEYTAMRCTFFDKCDKNRGEGTHPIIFGQVEECERHFNGFAYPGYIVFRLILAEKRTKMAILNFQHVENNCISKQFCKFELLARSDILTVELASCTDLFELKIYFRPSQQCDKDFN